MINDIRRWLTPPSFPDSDLRTRRASLLNYILLAFIVLVLFIFVGAVVGGRTPPSVLITTILTLAVGLMLQAWLRRGGLTGAGIGLLVVGLSIVTADIALLGTVRAPVTSVLLLLVMTAGLLFDLGGMIIMTVICSMLIAGLIGAENAGWLPRPDLSMTITQWATYTAVFAWAGTLMYAALRSMNRALARAERELHERQRAETALREAQTHLERRVEERTVELMAASERLQQELAERQQAEEALRQSEEQYRSLFDNMTEGFALHEMVVDETERPCGYRFLRVNPAFEQLTGLTRENLIGKRQSEVIPDEDPFWFETYCQVALTGESIHLEHYSTALQRHYEVFAYRPAPNQFAVIFSDITERKQAEVALQKSEQDYRNLFEMANDAILIFEPGEEIILAANAAACAIYGFTRDELIGLSLKKLTKDVSRGESQISQLLAAGFYHDFETIQTNRQGTEIHFLINSSVIEYQGRTAILSLNRDITARKRADDALRRQNQYLAALQEITLELSAQHELTSLLEHIVKRAGALMNTTSGFLDLVDPVTRQLLPCVGAGALAESLLYTVQPGEGLAGLVWQSGQPMVIEDYDHWAGRIGGFSRGTLGSTIAVPLLINQQVQGVLGLAYELTAHQTFGPEAIDVLTQFARLAVIAVENARLFGAERARHRELEAVYEASRQLTQSLEVTDVLNAVAGAVVQLTSANNVEIFLYEGERLSFGSGLSENGQPHRSFSTPRQDGLTYTAARNGETLFVDDTLHHPRFNAGASFNPPQLAIAALALKFEATVVGVMNVSYGSPHDFDEAEQRVLKLLATQAATAIQHARLHQQVRDYAQQLEQRVADRTAELQAANVRLTELDHLKDEFLSRTSHELRTPLTSIKIYLELLETAKPEKRETYLRTLNGETDRLYALIEDVLLFSQLSGNLEPSVLALIDLNNLIAGRLTTWQRLSAEHALQFQLDLAQDLPPVRTDGELLMQALTRLIANAVNYTPAGTVTVSTTRVDADSQSWIALSVKDTGPGITAADLPHIFERFYRGRAAADYKTPGTGIGLSISREIVEKLGGRLTVETQVGVGSTFTVWLLVTPARSDSGPDQPAQIEG